ncbi:SGNH/GDSL hydrolase family protein [Sorangium sp. So ce119]|uniref:SGNH/GDSL hydrolase family protein n=1 Tax=Sorangium sp. So ce119 TaxID=3133279 RepID=UPI003F61EA1B
MNNMDIENPFGGVLTRLGPVSAAFSDLNSLVSGRLHSTAWKVSAWARAPRVLQLHEHAGHSGHGRRYWVNHDALCADGGYLERPWTCPPGVSSVILGLDGVQLPPGVSSSPDFALQLLDSTRTNVLHATSFTPTSAIAHVATPAIAVTPGVQYWTRLAVCFAGQATFLCDRIRVRPVATSGIFAAPFVRIDAHPSLLHDSNEVRHEDPALWPNPRFAMHTSFASMRFRTSATMLAVEIYDTANRGLGDRGRPSVFVDSEPLDPPLPVTRDRVSYHEIRIPSGRRADREVVAHAGPQLYTSLPSPAREHRGAYLSALYVPADARLDVLRPPAARPDILFGDSKGTGYYSSYVGSNSMHFQLHERGVSLITYAAGGWYLAAKTGTGLTVAACKPLARELVRHHPARLWLQIGRNDLAGQTLGTIQNLATQLGNLCDACHELLPDLTIIVPTITREVNEPDVAGGSWNDLRALQRALVTGRDYVKIQDWASAWTRAEAAQFTADGVHPNDRAQEHCVALAMGELHPYSPRRISSLVGWWEADAGLGGGEMSSVTATGNTPPAVTISGTATRAFRLRVEVTTAGVPPNSRLRWSIDEGRYWEEIDVPLGASVPLPGTGLTLTMPTGIAYANNVVYTWNVRPASWADLSGNGNHLGVESAAYAGRYDAVGLSDQPGVLWAPQQGMRLLGLNLTAPYAVAVVATLGSMTPSRALVGRQSAGDGVLLYSTSSTRMSVADGTFQLDANGVVATAPHVYVAVVDGANSRLYVDGVAAVTGTLSNAPLTGIWFGLDRVDGWASDGRHLAAALFGGRPSDDEIACLTARWRQKYRF